MVGYDNKFCGPVFQPVLKHTLTILIVGYHNQFNGQQPEWLVMITNLMAHSTHNTPRPSPVPAPNTEVERTQNHWNFEMSKK